MAAPVRTCVGCRGRAAKSELVRLVSTGAVVIDLAARQPGRGAYLHRGPDCLAQAVRRRSLSRALRVGGVDAAALTTSWSQLQLSVPLA